MCGKLYWITGLSGAGKTTIGNLLFKHLKKSYPNTVIFDGDALRNAFGNDLGYSRQERLQCAMRYAGLSRLLVQQDIHVICCTISMFDQVREWNRNHIENYYEIYIKVPKKILETRNQKNLYIGQKDGNSKNVVGLDIEAELPKNPDIVLINDNSRTPEEMLQILLEKLE